jgi:hypothetical protein
VAGARLTKKAVRYAVSDNELYIHAPCKGCGEQVATFRPLHWDNPKTRPNNPAVELDEDDEGRPIFLFEWEQCVLKCVRCNRLAIAMWSIDPSRETDVHDKPNPFLRYATLTHIEPTAPVHAAVPALTPERVVSLLREAEVTLSSRAPRAAAALFRATLETTLKLNGYDQRGTLEQRINQAAGDRILTIQLETRAHRCRLLGNDCLHDGTTPEQEELEDIYGLVLLMVESFYRTRPEVEDTLRQLGRLPKA